MVSGLSGKFLDCLDSFGVIQTVLVWICIHLIAKNFRIFAKTFWTAMLPRWQSFFYSGVDIDSNVKKIIIFLIWETCVIMRKVITKKPFTKKVHLISHGYWYLITWYGHHCQRPPGWVSWTQQCVQRHIQAHASHPEHCLAVYSPHPRCLRFPWVKIICNIYKFKAWILFENLLIFLLSIISMVKTTQR